MTVRKILSARVARPKVEALLEALVQAAVFIGDADGRFGEEELDVFIDSMREVVSSAVGPDFVTALASTPKLLDQARAARRALHAQGATAFLAALTSRFEGNFARHGLVLAYRIVLADGQVSEKEEAAFEALARGLGVSAEEMRTLKNVAAHTEAASRRGHQGESVERVAALLPSGWKSEKAEHCDLCLSHRQPRGGQLVLELDAAESALHLYVHDAKGEGPHLLCLFHESLPQLLSVIDGMKDELSFDSLSEKLPILRSSCEHVFVEFQGRWG